MSGFLAYNIFSTSGIESNPDQERRVSENENFFCDPANRMINSS
jgi:hypothetical protein